MHPNRRLRCRRSPPPTGQPTASGAAEISEKYLTRDMTSKTFFRATRPTVVCASPTLLGKPKDYRKASHTNRLEELDWDQKLGARNVLGKNENFCNPSPSLR